MAEGIALTDRIRAEKLKEQIRVLEKEQGEIAGSASALMGTLQMVIASVVMGIVGAFTDGTALPMVVAFAACAVAALAITLVTLRSGGRGDASSPVAAPAE